jgi:hypothetical protein
MDRAAIGMVAIAPQGKAEGEGTLEKSAEMKLPAAAYSTEVATSATKAGSYGNSARESEAPRAPARGISNKNAELSVALSPPSLKLRRALLAIHPRSSKRGILAKESKPDGLDRSTRLKSAD